ncbi:hypothetical protein Csp2054_09100 [Curtobacterium sp. 'Ferrero']|nr:hypothetical protein Csp2054_09100 [Curtobacterium sp. 'Ferrero']
MSWLTGRRWSWRAADQYHRPVFYRGRQGRYQSTKFGIGTVAVFIDWKLGHNLPHEPNRIRRWLTGRLD